MRKIKVFFFNGFLLTITSLFLKSISMFFNIYISNKVGTQIIGIYSLIISVYMFFVSLASSGIHLSTTKLVSEQLAISNETSIKSIVSKCIYYSTILGIVAGIILFFSSSYISFNWLHGKVSSVPLKIISISLPFISISSSINGYFSSIRNIKYTVISQFFEQFLKIISTCYLINHFPSYDIETICVLLILSNTFSEILSSLFLYFLYKKQFKNIKSANNININGFTKKFIRITTPIAITSYIRSGLSTFKQILIPKKLELNGLSCETALSKYGIINGMSMPLILFPCNFISSFSMLLIPEFSYLKAKKDYNKINFAISKILKLCFIFSFLIMGIFLCFSKELSDSFYKEADVSFYVKILSPLIILMYIDNIVDSILKGLDKQVSVMGINILDLIASIFFICFLLPTYGIKGYIFVLFFSELLNGLFSMFILIRHTKIQIDFINWIFKPLFSIIFLNLIFKNFYCNSIFELIFQILLFVICYFSIIALSKGIIKSDIKF